MRMTYLCECRRLSFRVTPNTMALPASAIRVMTPFATPFLPVPVETGGVGCLRTINTVRDAAEVLLASPAEKRGGAWWTACKAAHGALSGTLDPETARKAFLKAARVAGVLVREGMPALSSIPFKQVIVQTDEIDPLRAVASVLGARLPKFFRHVCWSDRESLLFFGRDYEFIALYFSLTASPRWQGWMSPVAEAAPASFLGHRCGEGRPGIFVHDPGRRRSGEKATFSDFVSPSGCLRPGARRLASAAAGRSRRDGPMSESDVQVCWFLAALGIVGAAVTAAGLAWAWGW